MSEEKPSSAEHAHDKDGGGPAVVYRRTGAHEGEGKTSPGGKRRDQTESRIAPTLMPLLIGFALLLAFTFYLGRKSEHQVDDVSSQIRDLERQQSGKLSFALQLRVAATKLNTEARARARKVPTNENSNANTDTPPELRPPFDMPLRNARGDLADLMERLEKPPYSEMEKWRALDSDLKDFVKMTEDADEYARNGFVKFRDVNGKLDDLIEDARREQESIYQRSEELQKEAAQSIEFQTLVAILTGALVAAGTIWEVQRRFRQMRASMNEARREREFSTQILEGMVSAVAAIDERDLIRSANQAFFEIFPKASIGVSIYDKFASPEALKLLQTATKPRAEQSVYHGRWVLDASDEDSSARRTFDVYSSPLAMTDGRGQIITLVDVTEAAEAESILRRTESLAAVGQAAAQVAHEIKNPLGSIRLGVSMLRDMTTDKEAISTIDLVERGIEHLNRLTVDVTRFSRRQPLVRSEVELHEIINRSLELVADRIKEKGTPIEEHFAKDALQGDWDADQLRQVFVNLIANAVDAGAQHSPVEITTERIQVRAQEKRNRGNGHRGGTKPLTNTGPQAWARVTITDHGSGIDEQTRARIFEPFFTTKERGTGLGLAIVKQIVEQHDGHISVTSKPGEGTRFIVELPLTSGKVSSNANA